MKRTSNTPTPRTDALLATNNNDWHNPQLAAIDFTDLARTLERELADSRATNRTADATIARLRGALTQIANSGDAYNDLRTTARAALVQA